MPTIPRPSKSVIEAKLQVDLLITKLIMDNQDPSTDNVLSRIKNDNIKGLTFNDYLDSDIYKELLK